ncbi:hypothetical protein AOL_s00004g583 [Orbilia oligospora ATCC 24927]|uniref:Uncharacterized protein n=1 Tax=Arthrobotrys oligospora (strain ATCC 24927 / CBS 115.81 / DSM 1491) TaxID=756982 RepID=G1WZ72_ARTOA|nr:hypothetical protein AOL_s00004g583 [Orbilia oligospora ATCC 24927]EGX53924.1 hypothetical protein AOL_s00004g583 [Orbilia oligospora ATCC 24927]
MPSFASFTSKPLTIGKGRDHHKSYPPVSMKAPYLPETPHLDTSDLLVSVQSVPSPSELEISHDSKNSSRPGSRSSRSVQKSDPYVQRDTGFVGGHQYKIERQEERRRLRSLGLLTGTPTPTPTSTSTSTFQSEVASPQSPTMSTTPTSQKPDARRRSSWQPPLKGKLKKRNKSREPEQRKSIDLKHASIDFNTIPIPPPPPPHHGPHSFSRIQNYPASPMASPCATPAPMTPTRDLPHPNPPFSLAGRSNSSLGTMLGGGVAVPAAHAPSSLGNLVDFYDPNSPGLGQAFSTAPSSPIVPLNIQTSASQTASPIGFHRPRYTAQLDSPIDSVTSSPRLAAQAEQIPAVPAIPNTVPTKAPVQPFQSPLVTPPPSTSCGNSSTTSLNSATSQKPADKPAEKSGFQPYQPKYAAKSHVTSTVPLSQALNQEQIGTPFVHLDFAPPTKPFAPRPATENRRSTSETRLTTQEAKEYNAIAQATREAYYSRIQSPSETSISSKATARPQLTPSRLSYEVRSSPTPETQGAKSTIPPKSILRKPLDLSVEDIQETKEEAYKRYTFPQSVGSSTATTPEPLRLLSTVSVPTKSEQVSPIEPPVEESQPERGRSMFKRGEETSDSDLSRRNSMAARKSIEVEAPSAKNFDISKYTQERFSKPPLVKQHKSYPPVSYKAPIADPPTVATAAAAATTTNAEPSAPVNIPPVPPLPESIQSVRGLSTPPPIRSETAIESSDEEFVERPTTAESKKSVKSKLGTSVTTAETGPVRPRAPSMSEIFKDFVRHDMDDNLTSEPTEGTDWLSQLFRGKKNETRSRSRPASGLSTPGSSASPPLGRPAKKEKEQKRASKNLELTEEGRRVHERAERQRLQLERKLMEAESDLASTPRSPRFPRGTFSVTGSPDLRFAGTDASSLRSTSTTSVDRLEPLHILGSGFALGRANDLAADLSIFLDEKKPLERRRRPSSAEVRKQLGEMTPPHEREDWDTVRNSQGSFSTLNFPPQPSPQFQSQPSPQPQLQPQSPPQIQAQFVPPPQPTPSSPLVQPPIIPVAPLVIKPVPGRLPVAAEPSPPVLPSARLKEPLGLDHRTSNSSLISLDVTKTLTKILVICCNCNRLHDPPSDIYRKMAGGNSSFRCPYCIHQINVLDCCSAYTSICNLIEKLN